MRFLWSLESPKMQSPSKSKDPKNFHNIDAQGRLAVQQSKFCNQSMIDQPNSYIMRQMIKPSLIVKTTMNNNIFYYNIVIVSNFMHLPTYPGVPQAVAIMLSSSSVLDRPKSLIIILESSSGLQDRQNNPCELACNKTQRKS